LIWWSSHLGLFLLLAVTVLKFGRASSDLLAYGAADGSLTVCQVSEPPSILQKLIGHSKNITG
jgi:hypothetical protein